MTRLQLPYGHEHLELELPGEYHVDWIEPAYVPAAENPLMVVRQALKNPLGGRRIEDFAGARSVVIAINDKTRPVPHEQLLPPLLDALHAAGIPERAVTFLIATGTHIPMPPEEFKRVLPEEILSRYYSVLSHDCDDKAGLVFRGTTTRGTPVWGNRRFLEADLRIVTGNIEPHHFAGFSGGYKTAAIGLTGRETINHNHAMLIEPGSRIAHFDGNPLRQDIEEIGDALDVHFALNAILNGQKKIVQAVFGSPRVVMQAGIPMSQAVCQIRAGERYDVVIASTGGAPKDINFYQAQKALSHASLFTRDGGVIILAAACPEGSGSSSYEAFMEGVTTPQEVFDRFRLLGFRVGPHKAFQVAREAARVRIILVSQMPPGLTARLLMTPAASLAEAFEMAIEHLSPTPPEQLHIAALPRATNTIPITG